jgi:transcriptional regulator with XRE-family HTH domain
MKQASFGKRIKELRARRGFSQEELSEMSGLSLRTIQRLENGESDPRGDTLKRLSKAFNVTPDEITEWALQQDTGFLKSLNLSALSAVFFPVLGIITPLIIWISKKGKVQDVDKLAKELLNFQITWNICMILGLLALIVKNTITIKNPAFGDWNYLMIRFVFNCVIWYSLMSLCNVVLILINTWRIHKGRDAVYTPAVRFIRNQ